MTIELMFIYSYAISRFILIKCEYCAFNIVAIRIIVKHMLNESYIIIYNIYTII